ncbi:MAG: rhombosortase [Rubrivivax sp.]|nr:rhombosortase [Rubrivivax sp.]
MIAWWLPAAALDWQPGAALAQPWRLLTAAWVHWSPLHLGANLAATVAVAALGCAARLPAAAAGAWLLAWPLAHAGLWAQPALARYGGASGVLHAAVAVAACWLVATRRGRTQWVGWAIAAGLIAKLLLEQPWRGPLVQAAGWDIAVAPWAHASGALAGVTGALVVAGLRRPTGRLGRHGQSSDG